MVDLRLGVTQRHELFVASGREYRAICGRIVVQRSSAALVSVSTTPLRSECMSQDDTTQKHVPHASTRMVIHTVRIEHVMERINVFDSEFSGWRGRGRDRALLEQARL